MINKLIKKIDRFNPYRLLWDKDKNIYNLKYIIVIPTEVKLKKI